MRLEDVIARVEKIREEARGGDDERAHGLQDDLFADVLRHIAETGSLLSAPQLAAEALRALDIEFSRWCA